MRSTLMELAERAKTEHGYNISHEIAEIAREGNGKQLVSEVAISWLFDNHRDIYDKFYRLL